VTGFYTYPEHTPEWWPWGSPGDSLAPHIHSMPREARVWRPCPLHGTLVAQHLLQRATTCLSSKILKCSPVVPQVWRVPTAIAPLAERAGDTV
jgi:hypothetical protein